MTTENMREQVERMFPVDGPHSPEQTVAAAGALAHLVRYLNYATSRGRGPCQGVPYPGTVYDVIGNLRTLAERMPQLMEQTGERLRELAERPDAAQAPGGDALYPEQETPERTALAVRYELDRVGALFVDVRTRLGHAQVYAGRLYLTDTDGDDA